MEKTKTKKVGKAAKVATIYLVRTAVIAAMYACLTLAFAPISYAGVQFRVSEALTILPLLFSEAVPGLAIGCFFANMLSTPLDMILGTLATLAAALITRLVKKIYFGVIPPIIINALVVPVILLTVPTMTDPYWFNVLFVGLGELGAVVGLGVPLYFGVKKAKSRLLKG